MDRVYLYSIGATVGGILILGCWFLVDYQRRRDPNFKRKLKLKREYEKKLQQLSKSKEQLLRVENFEKYHDEDFVIIRELQVGEALLAREKYEEAVYHFANAIAVCSDPENFLKILKANLNPGLYYMLLNVLAKNNNSIASSNSVKQVAFVKDPFPAKSHVTLKC